MIAGNSNHGRMRNVNVSEGIVSPPYEPAKFIGTFSVVPIEDENALALATIEHVGTTFVAFKMGFDEEVSYKEKVRSTRTKKNKKKSCSAHSNLVCVAGRLQWISEHL
jgi:hypothetical protein